jgi:hypothetical protein
MIPFFDVYLRTADKPFIFPLTAEQGLLNNWDRLELLDAKAKLTLSPVLKDLGDGTALVDAEQVEFSCATLRVDSTEWGYLRDTFNGVVCDVMLYDPNSTTILAIAYRLKLHFTHIPTSGETELIQIYGKRVMGAGVADTALVVLQEAYETEYGLVSGTFTDATGAPVSGIVVNLGDGVALYSDETDKDGHYLIALLADGTKEYTFTFENYGSLVMPVGLTVTPLAATETVVDISEDKK